MRSFTEVHDELDAKGVAHEIIHLRSSSRTAQLAAEALCVPVSDVIKSLVFEVDGRPVLALVGGDATVDADALAGGMESREVALMRSHQVRELTGYQPGAVPPCALATDLPVIADPGVFAPEVVYCGGGTTTTMLKIRSADLDALLEPRKLAMARRP